VTSFADSWVEVGDDFRKSNWMKIRDLNPWPILKSPKRVCIAAMTFEETARSVVYNSVALASESWESTINSFTLAHYYSYVMIE
jgi:hypothetical protein